MKIHYTIGQAADYLNISVEAIRFYEKQGVIPAFHRDANNYRLIDQQHILFLKGVIQLRHAGFSLEEIKSIHTVGFSHSPEKQFNVLNQGINKIQEQILHLEKTKECLIQSISALKDFHSLIEKDCFVKKIKEDLKVMDLNALEIDHLLSDAVMILSLTNQQPVGSYYLLKAFIYKRESDIEKNIEDMTLYCKMHNLTFTGSILLNILSAPSYYSGDALSAILYMNLEDPNGNNNRF